MATNKPVPIDPNDTGEPDDLVPTNGLDAGPVTTAVERHVVDRVPAALDTARAIAIAAPVRAAGIGVSAARVGVAVGNHVSDRALAGIPGPDQAAHIAANWAARTTASVTNGGFLANGWGRFRKHRLPGEH